MVKNKAILEISRGERVYQLMLENTSPLGELFDVLTEMRSFVFEKIKQAEEAAKAKQEEKKPE